MKNIVSFIFLLIMVNGCATKPVIPQKPIVYSTGDRGVYLFIRGGKGGDAEITVLHTMDTVARVTTTYSFVFYDFSSKDGTLKDRLQRLTKHERESGKTSKYRIENGNVFLGENGLAWYSSENLIKENPKMKDFFELLSPDFINLNNAERVRVFDSLAQIDW